MDCPEPVLIETPKADLKTKKSKKFNSKDEKGKNLGIEMGLTNDSIIFKCEINNGIITKKFSSIYSFNKLKQNNIFTFQENIEEIYDQLEIYFNDEPVSSKINDNNVIIKVLTKIKKFPEIIFELKQEKIDNKEIINIMSEKINNLEIKINNLESSNKSIKIEYDNLKSENKTLKLEIENLKKNINQINEYINQQKEKEKKKTLKFGDSLIVKEDEDEMICNWINPNENIKTKLLYRVSRDGDGSDIFHKYCDNKGPTIIFAKINNGYRFGGYSGISWTCEGKCFYDKDAFLFSLNNKLKIMNNNTKETVYHGSVNGPDFAITGRNELVFNWNNNKCLTGKKNYCNDSGKAYTFRNKDLVGVDVKGEYNFDVEDYEVYSIII